MPSFHPKRKKIAEPETSPDSTAIDFSYIKFYSRQGGEIYAMTFQQMIQFFDNISDQLEEGEESAMFHLNQMKRILRKYLNGN
jgi:hypothetical protein